MRGPRGGPSGGVAIILPQGYFLDSWRVLVDGYAVEVLAHQQGADTARFVSLYLPDGGQRLVAQQIRRSLTQDDRPSFFSGDFNLQYFEPRAGEQEAVSEVASLLADHHSCVLIDNLGITFTAQLVLWVRGSDSSG